MTDAACDKPRPRLVVRRAVRSDLGGIMAIERVSFPTPWSESTMLREIVDTAAGVYLVADVGGDVAGYVGAWMHSGEAHILNIAVAPEYRGCGVGEILMLAMLGEAARASCDCAQLEYRVGNKRAEALYLKCGFAIVGRRPNYYFDTGEDASLATLDSLQSSQRQASLAQLREQWERKHEWAVELK